MFFADLDNIISLYETSKWVAIIDFVFLLIVWKGQGTETDANCMHTYSIPKNQDQDHQFLLIEQTGIPTRNLD